MRLINKLHPVLPLELIIVEADKGYDSEEVRREILREGFYPLILYRGRKNKINKWVKKMRWKVERAISWLKKGYRRKLLDGSE